MELIVFHAAVAGAIGPIKISEMDGTHFTIGSMCLSATSRGSITLKSSNPKENPLIDPNFLATEHDLAVLRSAIRTMCNAVESRAG